MSDNNGDRLSKSDCYNAALQLHNQEFRALGERTTAFLITQSILVAAFVYIIARQTQFTFELKLVALGVSLAGLIFCVLHYVAGRSGSQAASNWRQYMRGLEKNQRDAPWKQFEAKCQHKCKGSWIKHFLFQFFCEGCLIKRTPLPNAWLALPAIFSAVWVGAINYTVRAGNLCSYLCQTIILILSIVVLILIVGFRIRAWWHNERR